MAQDKPHPWLMDKNKAFRELVGMPPAPEGFPRPGGQGFALDWPATIEKIFGEPATAKNTRSLASPERGVHFHYRQGVSGVTLEMYVSSHGAQDAQHHFIQGFTETNAPFIVAEKPKLKIGDYAAQAPNRLAWVSGNLSMRLSGIDKTDLYNRAKALQAAIDASPKGPIDALLPLIARPEMPTVLKRGQTYRLKFALTSGLKIVIKEMPGQFFLNETEWSDAALGFVAEKAGTTTLFGMAYDSRTLLMRTHRYELTIRP